MESKLFSGFSIPRGFIVVDLLGPNPAVNIGRGTETARRKSESWRWLHCLINAGRGTEIARRKSESWKWLHCLINAGRGSETAGRKSES